MYKNSRLEAFISKSYAQKKSDGKCKNIDILKATMILNSKRPWPLRG